MYRTILFVGLHVCMYFPAFSQCSIPAGAVKLETGAGAAVDFATVTSVSKVYYVPSATTVSINHSGALSIGNSGTILVLDGAVLNINMGGSNFTVNGGAIQLCQGAKMNVNPGHDFTLQNNSDITLGVFSHFNLCNFGHDITFNGGNVTMSDYSSFEISDYHNFVISSANIFKYSGAGTTGIGTGNPIVHTTGDDFSTYSNTNALSSNLTASNHIDFVNDAHGGDKPGSANYCGPMASSGNLACRSQWFSMNFACGAAASYLDVFQLLPVYIQNFSGKNNGPNVQLAWTVTNDRTAGYFQVQELYNGNPVLVKEIKAKNSNAPVEEYSFEQQDVEAGMHYYRLKISDKQGRTTYSNTVKIVTSAPNNEIDAFFNAGLNQLLVYTKKQSAANLVIVVYDVNGRQLVNQQFHVISNDALTKLSLDSHPEKFKIVAIQYGQLFKRIKIAAL